jgi:hypothetical protein
MTYGTVFVDLERRRIVELRAGRSAASTAEWLTRHPGVEVVSRDRAGLYATGARQGAPQARQVADRFHLLQNSREARERQLTRLGPAMRRPPPAPVEEFWEPAAERLRLARRTRHAERRAVFDRIRELCDADRTARKIARELGLRIRRVRAFRTGCWNIGHLSGRLGQMVSNDRAGIAAGVGVRDAIVRVLAGNSKDELSGDAVESLNRSLRAVIQLRRDFPMGCATMEML